MSIFNCLRKWKFIYNSRVDLYELWLSGLLFLISLHIITTDSVIRTWYFNPFQQYNISSLDLSIICMLISIISIIKTFLIVKIHLCFDLIIKASMFFIFTTMAMATSNYAAFHIISIFYSMVAILNLIVIIKTK